jgi:O-antigen/teichoic acid export membrane protein
LKEKLRHIKKNIENASSHPGVRKYFFNTGWMFAEKGLRLIAGVFIGAYVARYLGPSQYGLLNYVISLVYLVSVFSYVGLETIIVRELVRDESKRDSMLGTAFVLRLTAAVIAYGLLIVINESVDTDRTTKSLVYIIGCSAMIETFGVIDYFFQAKVWAKYIVWSQMTALAGVSIFRIALVLNHAELVWFAWTSVIDLFIVSSGLIFFYINNSFSLFNWRFDKHMARTLLSNSWPLIFSSIAGAISLKIDQVMIKWMMGDGANGNYGVAVRLSEMWNFIPVAICGSLFPAILNAKIASNELYLTRLQRLYDLMVVISLSIAIAMTFLSGFIVHVLFGDAYADSATILTIYIWSSVFLFVGIANGKWVISENLQKFRMVSSIGGALINIVLNLILIKWIGLYGAAFSTLISYMFAYYLSFLFTEKTRPMFISISRSLNLFTLMKRVINSLKN